MKHPSNQSDTYISEVTMSCLFLLALVALSPLVAWLCKDGGAYPGLIGGIYIDSTENVLYAFYLAKGLTAYRDFASNHFPGVYLYLSGVFDLAGFSNKAPSPEFFDLAWITARKAIAACQLVIAFVFWRFLKFSNPKASVLAIVLTCTLTYSFGLQNPLSEHILAYMFLLFPLLIYRFCVAGEQSRLKFAMIFIFPFSLISLLIGLTLLPSILVGMGAASICIFFDRHDLKNKSNWHYLVGCLAFTVALLGYFALKIDYLGMLWFNFKFNASIAPMVSDLVRHAQKNIFQSFVSRYTFMSSIGLSFILICGLSCLAFVRFRSMPFIRHALLFITLLIGTLVGLWREPEGTKIIPIYGINIGLACLILREIYQVVGAQSRRMSGDGRFLQGPWRSLRFRLGAGLLMILLAAASSSIFMHYHKVPKEHQSLAGAAAVFEANGICKLGQNSGCKCVRLTNFDPIFFLENDVRQCSSYGIYIPLIPGNPEAKRQLIDDAQSREVAFVVYPDDVNRFLSFPEEIIASISHSKVCMNLPGREAHVSLKLCAE